MLCSKRKKKKKECKENKSKKKQNAFNMIASMFLGEVGVVEYLEGDSPHMIVCKCILFSHISNLHNMRHLCTLAMPPHTTCKFFATFDTCAGTM